MTNPYGFPFIPIAFAIKVFSVRHISFVARRNDA